MTTFLTNLLRNQSIYATKIIEYCSMLSDFVSLYKNMPSMMATKMIKNKGGLFKTISDNFIDN